jgi:hypothetical protein
MTPKREASVRGWGGSFTRGAGLHAVALVLSVAAAIVAGPGGAGCSSSSSSEHAPIGEACSEDGECGSGHCQSGVCCLQACGECESCAEPGRIGTCTTVADGTSCATAACVSGKALTATCQAGVCTSKSDSCGSYACGSGACKTSCSVQADCASDTYCASGKCASKLKAGTTCASPGDCESGFCPTAAGKVCCDAACTGECQTCSASGSIGACSPLAAGTSCGAGLACSEDSTGSYVVTSQCDGKSGTCQSQSKSCGDYRCDSSAKTPACKTSCSSHSDCFSGLCDLLGLSKKATCLPASEICFADAGATSTGSGTSADPYAKIQDCLAAKKKYVAVADGTYDENLAITASVSLLSLGTDVASGTAPTAKLAPAKAKTAGVALSGTIQVLLFGFDLAPGSGGSGDLVQLTGNCLTNARPTLALRNVAIHDAAMPSGATSGGSGIAATCAVLDLEDVAVSGCGDDGIQAVNSDVTATRVTSKKNTATGLYAKLFSLGGTGTKISIVDSTLSSNAIGLWVIGTGGCGSGCSELSIDRTRVQNNKTYGVELVDTLAGAKISNSLVTGNLVGLTASNALGKVVSSTISGNSYNQIACSDATVHPTFTNDIVWSDAEPTVSWSCECYSCDIRFKTGEGKDVALWSSISKDPEFDALSSEVYSLKSTSPCVDKGSDAAATGLGYDLLGNPRSVDKVSGGAKVDMGAFEVQ